MLLEVLTVSVPRLGVAGVDRGVEHRVDLDLVLGAVDEEGLIEVEVDLGEVALAGADGESAACEHDLELAPAAEGGPVAVDEVGRAGVAVDPDHGRAEVEGHEGPLVAPDGEGRRGDHLAHAHELGEVDPRRLRQDLDRGPVAALKAEPDDIDLEHVDLVGRGVGHGQGHLTRLARGAAAPAPAAAAAAGSQEASEQDARHALKKGLGSWVHGVSPRGRRAAAWASLVRFECQELWLDLERRVGTGGGRSLAEESQAPASQR